MTHKLKTLFLGTPDFAVTILESLARDPQIELVGVITQPDRPVGRKQVVTPPPVKTFALKHGLPIEQPEKVASYELPVLSRAEGRVASLDLIVVAAYAQILPKKILDLPKYGCLNVHASLLPKYRGASCVAAAIRDGEAETGVTVMKMDEGLDTGPILAQAKIMIAPDDTTGTLTGKLARLGTEILLPAIKGFAAGKIEPEFQDDSFASYAPALKKIDGRIDWNKKAGGIERFIRAMSPWPSAWSVLRVASCELRVKILETEHRPIYSDENKQKTFSAEPGTFFIHDNKLAIQCGDGALIVKQIQPEGKKVMSGEDFMRGYGF